MCLWMIILRVSVVVEEIMCILVKKYVLWWVEVVNLNVFWIHWGWRFGRNYIGAKEDKWRSLIKFYFRDRAGHFSAVEKEEQGS